jgi:putative phosphoesterase
VVRRNSVRSYRPQEEVEATATLSLGAADALIAAVADTHSRPHPGIAEHLTALGPAAILHAGDIGDLSVLDELRAIAPVFAVRGNIDGRAPGLADVLTLDVQGEAWALRILLVHIAVYGPKIRAEIARKARDAGASLIVCGHSHVPFIGQDRELTVFNPGSIGPRRFQLPIVFGTIRVTRDEVRLAHVDCETGRAWQPPR